MSSCLTVCLQGKTKSDKVNFQVCAFWLWLNGEMNRNQEDPNENGETSEKCKSTSMVLQGIEGNFASKWLVHWPPWRRGWHWRSGGCTCRLTWGQLLPWWPSPWRCLPVDQWAAAHLSLLRSPHLLLYRHDDGLSVILIVTDLYVESQKSAIVFFCYYERRCRNQTAMQATTLQPGDTFWLVLIE